MGNYHIGSKITHESLEGEVIAIHFDTGAYYSFRGAAARIWEAVAASIGCTKDIAARFQGDLSEIEVVIETFMKSLCNEGLLEAGGEPPDLIATPADNMGSLIFEAPVFERFDDMRDLLLADPIHEVSEEGWPHVKS